MLRLVVLFLLLLVGGCMQRTIVLSGGYMEPEGSAVLSLQKGKKRKVLTTDPDIVELMAGKIKAPVRFRIINNTVDTIPDFMYQIHRICSLEVINTNIDYFPEQIGTLTDLQFLRYDMSRFKQLPINIGNLSRLKTLSLSGDELEELPSTIKQLKQLESLDISDNKFESIPKVIGELPKLKRLVIGFLPIQELSDTSVVWTINSLEELSIRGGYLEQFSPRINALHQLKKLELEYNSVGNQQLQQLHPDSLPFLKELNINRTALTSFPIHLCHFKNLTHLEVGENEIKHISNSLEDFSSLEVLILKKNPIKSLPATLGQLQYLKCLDIRGTKIQKLPPSFKKLKKLQSVYLSEGQEYIKQQIQQHFPNCEVGIY